MSVTYTYLCEDKALELFVEKTLEAFKLKKTKCKDFEKGAIAYPIFASNKDQVLKQYKDAAKKAISGDKLELFIAAYDWDYANPKEYETTLKKQIADIHGKARSRTVMCVPIKCVEYWLWYVKHADNENEPVPDSLENNPDFNSDFAKSDVYERALDERKKYSKQSVTTEISKAESILKMLDVDKLAALSPSFKHFVAHISKFCNTHG